MQIRDLVKRYDLFSLFGRSLPRIHLYGVALYLGLPSGGDRAERGADRLGVETLLGVRHPHRGAHHQKPCAARRRDEVLPGAAVAAARGADRRRGVDRCAARVPYGGVRRVYRPPQVPDRRSEPPAGRLFADPPWVHSTPWRGCRSTTATVSARGVSANSTTRARR